VKDALAARSDVDASGEVRSPASRLARSLVFLTLHASITHSQFPVCRFGGAVSHAIIKRAYTWLDG